MIRFFRNLRLDSISFLAGFIAATLFWWLLRMLRPAIRKGWENFKTWLQSARQGILVTTEQRHRSDTLKYVQGLHLSAALFSLDEILVTPRLMAPPALIVPDETPPYEEIVSRLIPFTPDWPELAASYQANTLDVFETLQLCRKIAITGNPGIGKTTTLAYIASQLAYQNPKAGELKNSIPLFIRIEDLELPGGELNDPLDTIIESVSKRASSLTLPRLPEMIRTSFEMERAILLLDGIDELAPEPMSIVVDYLGKLIAKHPGARVVVTTSATNFKGLPQLGFVPFPVAAWGYKIQASFIQRWRHLWNKYVADKTINDGIDPIDPLILNGWLLNLDSATTPLDFTLKIWSAYAGDTRGPRVSDGLEAFIQRLSFGIPNARITMELLASKILQNMTSTFSEGEAKSWISMEFSEAKENDLVPLMKPDSENDEITVPRVLSELTHNGLLSIYSNRKLGFVHPIIAGYLAGFALTLQSREEVSKQPSWSLKDIATIYMTYLAGMGAQVRSMLSDEDDLFLRNRLILGRRLPNLPHDSSERKLTQQQLSSDLQNEKLPMNLRIRTLTALAMSRDPGILALFHHLMSSEHPNIRQLAVLGYGYLRDDQAIGDLIVKLGDVTNVGQASCLALVNIGTKPALEAVASVLLQGSEQMRQAAAESFATHPTEGYPILKEGSKVDDLLVRKAVIHGLRRVNEHWATQILEEMRIDDPQWVVKDSAAQAVEDLNNPDPCIPRPQPELEDLPWLIQFASDRGLGISKGKPARDMLLRVLGEGNEEEILAALGQICYCGEFGVFPSIYQIFYGENPELIERAYYTIWYIASMGIKIPPPS